MTKLKETLKGPSGQKILAGVLALMLITSIFVVTSKRKTVTLAYDGKTEVVNTYKNSVKGLIEGEEISLGEKDKVSHSLHGELEDGMKINIKRAVPVKLVDAGKVKEVKTATATVNDFLKEENIKLSELDKITPAADKSLEANMSIDITRVTEKVETVSEVLPFKVQKEVNEKQAPGTVKTVKEGANGRKEIVMKSVYENGVEVSKTKVSETVACKPVHKVIASGPAKSTVTAKDSSRNKDVVTASRGGRAFSYKKEMTMTATAYSQAPYDPQGGGSITASGTKVKRNPSGYSTVAVDPRVIPLGTKLYVEGYGYAIAADTGGAIKGNKIDLYFEPGSEYTNWGKRTVKVYIL